MLLIGLGSDYNVFIAGRIRGEARHRRLREAIAVAAPAASRAITVAGITLASTFALLALVPLRPFRELALLMAIGVLVDALIVRPILIPALIALVGPRGVVARARQRPPARGDPRPGRRADRAARRGSRGASRTPRSPRSRSASPSARTREVARRLPRCWRAAARPRGGASRSLRGVRRPGGGAGPVAAGGVRDDVRAVFLTLRDVLPETEVDYVRAALSEDYRGLLGDALTAADTSPSRFERDGERAVPGV